MVSRARFALSASAFKAVHGRVFGVFGEECVADEIRVPGVATR